jgi:hypothetical protein
MIPFLTGVFLGVMLSLDCIAWFLNRQLQQGRYFPKSHFPTAPKMEIRR